MKGVRNWWYGLKKSKRSGLKALMSVAAILLAITLISPQVGAILFMVFGGLAAFIVMIIALLQIMD
jgi:hypothetical protein